MALVPMPIPGASGAADGGSEDGQPATLVEECARGLELFGRVLAPLEQLGGGGELRPVCHQLLALVGTEVVVAVDGDARGAALRAMLGIDLVVDEPAPGVTVRLRHAAELGYRASWSDGSESSSAEESAALAEAVVALQRAAHEESDCARELDGRLQVAMDAVVQAQRAATGAGAALATATATASRSANATATANATANATATNAPNATATNAPNTTANAPATGAPNATDADPATNAPFSLAHSAPPAVILARTRALLREPDLPPPPPPRRSSLRAFLTWLFALFARVFKRTPAATPTARLLAPRDALSATPAAADTARTHPSAPTAISSATSDARRRRDQLAAALDRAEALEADLAASRARLDALAADRDHAERRLARHRSERERRILMRVRELSRSDTPVDLDVEAPYSPDGVVLLLRAPDARTRETADATVAVHPNAPHELLPRILQIRDQRPAEVARRLAAALCSCRNQIVDLDERGRQAHQRRLGELSAETLAAPPNARDRELALAQRPLAQELARIVDEAATELERLVEEVRRGWLGRIGACAGIELLRAEVAAIEDGAAHRLSLVCEELREKMTVQLVRLVLEQSRSLRQEVLRKRHEVARGRSPKVEETFDDVRLDLPASLDRAFAALRAPELGELLTSERSLFDPLFRTVAREKRQCASRLDARLDDMKRTTARELYASTVLLAPLLSATLAGLLDELLAAHAAWIDERLADERRADAERSAILQPALELVEPLAAAEARLASLLEAALSAGATPPRSPTTRAG
jgi:hypothetical protein